MWLWCSSRSRIAVATTGSPKTISDPGESILDLSAPYFLACLLDSRGVKAFEKHCPGFKAALSGPRKRDLRVRAERQGLLFAVKAVGHLPEL